MNSSVVFDLDGTLITCENKQKYVLFSILNCISGINFSELNTWWELKRNGYNTEQALIALGFPMAKLISEKWVEIVESFSNCFLDSPYSDSLTSLQYLKTNSINHISILTARSNTLQAYQAIYRFGFDKYIDDLVVVNPKYAVQEKMGYLKKSNPFFFVGDSESDYFAANKSKTRFIALSRGQRSIEYLKNIGDLQIEPDLSFLRSTKLIFDFKH